MTDTSNIHRYLDTAFSGIELTPEVQDLKEEVRGNLTARVAELQASGKDASAAARIAIDELGDINDLVESIGSERRARGNNDQTQAYLLNRVRPKPAFVIRTVVLALVVLATMALAILGWLQVLDLSLPVLTAIVVIGLVLPAGVIVADGLQQQTTSNYPLPAGRATMYGIAASVMLLGLWLGFAYLLELNPWIIAGGAVLVLGAAIGFTWLGVTQTNRKKPWLRDLEQQGPKEAFSDDPEAAARFGIYTIVIWVVAGALFGILSATIGFAWSWIAFVGGFVVFFLTLARMTFPPRKEKATTD